MSRVMSFPHMGDYWVPIKALGESLDCEVLVPPPTTKRTLELGTKHSPEFVCIPFKYNMGNFIEALEAGADLLVQAGGGCRFSYYAEVQEVILRDLGYEFEFLKLTSNLNPVSMYADFRRIDPGMTRRRFIEAWTVAYHMMRALDDTDDIMRRNLGFARDPEEFGRLRRDLIAELDATRDVAEVRRIRRDYERAFAEVPVERPERPMRVGVVGELYDLMEPFANFYLEEQLGRRGVEVHRFVTLTNMLKDGIRSRKTMRRLLHDAAPYLRYHVGADGTDSVAWTNRLMHEGFDGMVHVKPFGCMPEVNAMAALQRLSREHTFPVLFLSFDSQTSETGLRTRLEAFCDMIEMRKGAAA